MKVAAGPAARTRADVVTDLLALGVVPGRDVLVHCSLRRLGGIADGPSALYAAIRDVVGPKATVVVPTQTANNSLSSPAFQETTRGMDDRQRADFVARMDGFDPTATPSSGMGALAEHIRLRPDAVRSAHPQTSFAAIGPRAAELMSVHDIDCHLGERSPLAALYTAGADVLLLGVGYEACTALHLAEYRLPWPAKQRAYTCYVSDHGHRIERRFVAADLDASSFRLLGACLDKELFVKKGVVGRARSRLLPVREAVDFAIPWMVNLHTTPPR